MDHRRFDALTRTLASGPSSRRGAIRLAAGGLATVLLVRVGLREAAAACKGFGKKCTQNADCCSRRCTGKRGKKTCNVGADACRDRSQPCSRDNQCCAGGQCRRRKCRCRPAGAPCTGFAGCCSQSCDFLVDGGTCSPCRGRGCASSRDCCGGLSCQNSYCGGCRDRGVVCSGPSDCCFSDCSTNAGTTVCLSDAGGRCARDVDCARCYLDGNCDGACVDGRCTEPG